MARLSISYKREEQAYAFALRPWLMDVQGWAGEVIFVDVGHLHAGVDWEARLLAEAEAAEAMLFLASDLSLDIRSFCYRELQHAFGQILAVTIKGVAPEDERLMRAIPGPREIPADHRARPRTDARLRIRLALGQHPRQRATER